MLPRRLILPVFAGILSLLGPRPAGAQTASDCRPPLLSSPADPRVGGPGPRQSNLRTTAEGGLCQSFPNPALSLLPAQSIQERSPTPGRAFLLSAIVPGVGQRSLGQDRWIAYVAAEVWAWIQYLDRRGEGRELQGRYRDLAWLVARRVSTGPRVDGNFEYYEAMTEYGASGAYDIDPAELGVQPEADPATYNGFIWGLAREIFSLDDPDNPVDVGSDHYQKALRYYRSRAYTPEFAWNWSDNTLQQSEFKNLIRQSDENLRRGTTMVGVIIANHLLSAVDALVTGRLLQQRAAEPLLELTLLPGPHHQDALSLSVRIPYR